MNVLKYFPYRWRYYPWELFEDCWQPHINESLARETEINAWREEELKKGFEMFMNCFHCLWG